LRELDGILAEQMQRLRALQSQMMEEEVTKRMAEVRASGSVEDSKDLEERQKRYTEIIRRGELGRESTSLVLHFSNGGRLETRSFEEASAHAEVSQSEATSFDLNLECGTVSLQMNAESDSFDTELTLGVSPSGTEGARSLFSALRRWLRTIQAPRSQQWWCRIGHFRYGLWFAFGYALLMIFLGLQDNVDSGYYKQQAHELIKQGVTADKQQKAIETLLALASDYSAPVAHGLTLTRWFWFFCVGGTIVCLILSYPPRIVLGLGVGEEKIIRWQRWTRFVLVIVPGFVASNFLYPVIVQAIKRLAPR
jgi:hypothetical protein